jgi:hypothetical protein
MRKSAVERLAGTHWFPVEGDSDGMEVEVRSSALWTVQMLRGKEGIREVCNDNFVGFKNYYNGDGKEVPNTLDERVLVFSSVMAVQNAVAAGIGQLQAEVLQGEDDGASG